MSSEQENVNPTTERQNAATEETATPDQAPQPQETEKETTEQVPEKPEDQEATEGAPQAGEGEEMHDIEGQEGEETSPTTEAERVTEEVQYMEKAFDLMDEELEHIDRDFQIIGESPSISEEITEIPSKVEVQEVILDEEATEGFPESLFEEALNVTEVSAYLTEEVNVESEMLEEEEPPDFAAKTRKELSPAALERRITPFFLSWTYGINTKVPLINLTTRHSPVVFYVGAHAGILLDYKENLQTELQAHKAEISSISTDANGTYLVTADYGKESTVNFWDSSDGHLFYTLYNTHEEYGVAKVAMSGNARYLLTVGNEPRPTIKFWLWTFGKEVADATYAVQSNVGRPVRIRFNPDQQEFFMVAFEKQIFFFAWDSVKANLGDPKMPTPRMKKAAGKITDCAYLSNCHECFVSTDTGCICVYGNTLYTLPPEEAEVNNQKIFVKTVKVSHVPITAMESCDDLITTGDILGHIKFYDRRVRIMQWCQDFRLEPVVAISFNMEPRKYRLRFPWDYEDRDDRIDVNELADGPPYEDYSEEYETLYSQLVPSDATLFRVPFIVRDFVVVTSGADVVAIDFINNQATPLICKLVSYVTTIDVHTEKPYIVVGFDTGQIYLIDYTTHKYLVGVMLPEEKIVISDENDEENPGEEIVASITSIKYCPRSLSLACGRQNGSLWFLDPVLLAVKYEEPFKAARGSITKLCYSCEGDFLAYYDSNGTVCLFCYDKEDTSWRFLGKVRAHYKPVIDILFTPYCPSRLFTIGVDRDLAEYDLYAGEDGTLPILRTERIAQTSIPSSFSYLPQKPNTSARYFCLTDNKFKMRLLNDQTFMCRSVAVGPVYDCYEESVLTKTEISKLNEEYLLFMSSTRIGIQKLPADGNPFKFIGLTGHPTKLKTFRQTPDGKNLFTFGENDRCILKWDVNLRGVDNLELMGGDELEPFYCMIEGGAEGWLYKEMEDLFYYMQILHQGANTLLPRQVSDFIPVTELPDLMRACGYYPTEYEIEDMIVDIKYRNFDELGTIDDKVSFLDFIKLYINHRPAQGISLQSLEEAFENLKEEDEEVMQKEQFIDTMCEIGEPFTKPKLGKCLSVLMNFEGSIREKHDFAFLPDEVTFDYFVNEMLGIDMDRSSVENTNVRDEQVELP